MSKKTTNNATVNASFVAMKATDVKSVKDFCKSTKMLYNESLDSYDFEAHKKNVRVCGFGKSDMCRTASIWYAPKREDYGVRLEKDTFANLSKSASNKALIEAITHFEESYSTKQNEFRFSFNTLKSALDFFKTLQSNYKKEVASKTKEAKKEATKEVKEATKEA